MKLEELGLNEEELSNVTKLLQSETDRVRTDYVKQIKDLEKFKPIDKTPQEIALEERLKALEDREKAIQQQERQSQLQAKLSEKGLDSQLYKYLNVGDDADTFIEEFATVMNKTLLDGSYKPSTHKSNKDVITKEQFANMGYFERSKLQETNPTLFSKLSE